MICCENIVDVASLTKKTLASSCKKNKKNHYYLNLKSIYKIFGIVQVMFKVTN